MAIIFDWFENPKHHEAEAPCTYALLQYHCQATHLRPRTQKFGR